MKVLLKNLSDLENSRLPDLCAQATGQVRFDVLRQLRQGWGVIAEAPAPAATDAEVADAEAALSAALAARGAAAAAVKSASPAPNLPGYPALPQLFAALRR